MKSYLKFFALIGAVTVSAVTLSACSHQDDNPPAPTTTSAPAPTPAPAPVNQPGS